MFLGKFTDWTPHEYACALAAEVGEVCGALKGDRQHEQDRRRAAVELADVVLFADMLVTRLGFRLEDMIRYKFNKVSEKYGSEVKL